MIKRGRKSAQERKADIVNAVILLAGEIGPDALTIKEVSAKVGISEAAIFRHFESKNAIWEAVAYHIGQRMRIKVSAATQVANRPADEIVEFVVNHLKFIQTNPAIPAILFSRELHVANNGLRQYFAGLIESRQQYLKHLIDSAIRQGDYSATVDSNDAAYLILSLIQGLAMRWSLNDRNFNLPEEGRRLLLLLLCAYNK